MNTNLDRVTQLHDVKNQSSIHMIETMLKSTKLNDFISDAYSPYYNEAFSWGASHLQSDMKWKSALKNEDMLKNRMCRVPLFFCLVLF